MELKDIITLIQTVSDSKLTSFEYQEGDTKLAFQINRESAAVHPQKIVEESVIHNTETDSYEEDDDSEYITSPMVGTFYSSASEDAKPFIQVGDVIKKGQVIGIVEAMKLMNEIESPYDGIVEEIYVGNREMIGFEQVLVRVRP